MDQDQSQFSEVQNQPQSSHQDMVRPNGGSNDAYGQNIDPKEPRFWRRWLEVERLQAVFNFLLVVVTTVYTFVSCEQWQVTKDSLRLTQRAVGIADRQAKAAHDANLQTRQFFEATERPWLSADITMIHPLRFDEDGGRIDLSMNIKNVGRSVALGILELFRNKK